METNETSQQSSDSTIAISGKSRSGEERRGHRATLQGRSSVRRSGEWVFRLSFWFRFNCIHPAIQARSLLRHLYHVAAGFAVYRIQEVSDAWMLTAADIGQIKQLRLRAIRGTCRM